MLSDDVVASQRRAAIPDAVRQQPERRITELRDSDVTMPHVSNKDHISPKFRLDYFMLPNDSESPSDAIERHLNTIEWREIVITGSDPILLTPGPLTTSPATRQAMLRDWGSWDAAFNRMTSDICRDLLAIVSGEKDFVCVPHAGQRHVFGRSRARLAGAARGRGARAEQRRVLHALAEDPASGWASRQSN